jgi:hypothetical protein
MLHDSPTRLNVAKVYFKRATRWNRSSYPYISGDAFADLSDVSVYKPKFRGIEPSLKAIKNANVIFCPSSKLIEFLENFHKLLSVKVIIAGNDDTEFHKELVNIPKSVRKMYLQNSFISDNERIFTLPIGIENFRYGVNGHPKLMQPILKSNTQNKILFGPFSATHETRIEVKKLLIKSHGPWVFFDAPIKPKEFQNHMSTYNWIGVVRGNGIDTHRLWEALYRERIPIVKSDLWSRSLAYLNLPIYLTSDWHPNTLINFLKEHETLPINSNKLESLWMPWWKKQINHTCI